MSSTTDLIWDHSAGENLQTYDSLSDDLEPVNFYNGALINESISDDSDVIKISRRHLSFILRSLDEATSLLREQGNLQDAIRQQSQAQSPNSSSIKGVRRCYSKFINIISRFNLFITIFLQGLMLILVTIIDSSSTQPGKHKTSHNKTKDVVNSENWSTYFVMWFLMAVNFCLILYISVQLTKTILESRASALMLAQSYLSTVIMFAGIYVITYRMNKKGWTLHGFNAVKDDEAIVVSYLFLKMLYHSISSSTLCGSSTVHPDIWYNFILVAVQMLLSFLYFTSILRVVVDPPSNMPKKCRNTDTPLRHSQSTTSLQSRYSIPEQTHLLNYQVNGTPEVRRYGGL